MVRIHSGPPKKIIIMNIMRFYGVMVSIIPCQGIGRGSNPLRTAKRAASSMEECLCYIQEVEGSNPSLLTNVEVAQSGRALG